LPFITVKAAVLVKLVPMPTFPVIVSFPVNAFAASVRAIVAEEVGNVIVVESVPAIVIELLAVKVLPDATRFTTPASGSPVALVNVPDAGVPRVGVTNVIEVHVPVGVYDPPSSSMVSAASRTVIILFVLVKPVKLSNPVCPEIDKEAAAPPIDKLAAVPVRLVPAPLKVVAVAVPLT
jgi:hypothetical protein